MSLEEGYKAVHQALFGMAPGAYINKGKCTRCGMELRFSPSDGNCQPDCHFSFGLKREQKPLTIFHGAWVKFAWEADLCDRCLGSLSDWLLGPDWRQKEAMKKES